MTKKYEHLFFDLDHTLWDFETNSRETIFQLFDLHHLKKKTKSEKAIFYKKYTAINEGKWTLYRAGKITKEKLRAERWADTFRHFGLDDFDFSQDFENEYLEKCPQCTALFPNALEILAYLKPKYKLHILTNGFAETQATKLKMSGLQPFFENVFSSEEIGVNKPNAAIFVEAMKRAGASRKNSLMIGDNLFADILGAKNVGMDQVYFNPHQILHGEKPTFEIAKLLELKTFL